MKTKLVFFQLFPLERIQLYHVDYIDSFTASNWRRDSNDEFKKGSLTLSTLLSTRATQSEMLRLPKAGERERGRERERKREREKEERELHST